MGCRKLLSGDLEALESLTALSGHKMKITVKEVIPFPGPFARISLLLSFEGHCGCGPMAHGQLTGQCHGCGYLITSLLSQNSIYLNEEAKVVVSDIVGMNGVLHFINKILIPSDLVDRNISSKTSRVRLKQ